VGSLTLSTRRDGDRWIVSVAGELDLATVPTLRDAARPGLDDPAVRALVLDLAELTFLDSTGLGCWIELRNVTEDTGKMLILESVPPSAMRTLSIAGLAPLFGLDGGARTTV
jgi:anti-sigma B factor antagonist